MLSLKILYWISQKHKINHAPCSLVLWNIYIKQKVKDKSRMKSMIKYSPWIYTAFIPSLFQGGIFENSSLRNHTGKYCRSHERTCPSVCCGGIWEHSEFTQNYNQKERTSAHNTDNNTILFNVAAINVIKTTNANQPEICMRIPAFILHWMLS